MNLNYIVVVLYPSCCHLLTMKSVHLWRKKFKTKKEFFNLWPVTTTALTDSEESWWLIFVWAQNEEAAQAGAGSERESEIGPSFYISTNMSHQLSSLSVSAVCVYYSWAYTQKRRHFLQIVFTKGIWRNVCWPTVYKLSTQKMLEKNSFPDKNHTFWAHFMILCAKHQIGHRYTGTLAYDLKPRALN